MLLQLCSSSAQPQGFLDMVLVVEVVLLIEAGLRDGYGNVQGHVWLSQALQREAANEGNLCGGMIGKRSLHEQTHMKVKLV